MKKESLELFNYPDVRIFICGPTMYDYLHLGHARTFIVYDVIARYLKYRGYRPFVLLNLTDIDRKVFEKAKKENIDYRSLVAKYTEELKKDLELINVESINIFVVGTDYIDRMKANISRLLDNGYAYTVNGNIYFDTLKVEGYGALSHQNIDDLMMHRIDLAPNKKNQFDFLIWNGRDRFDVKWESAFGTGIPWWHIQDTTIAMSVFETQYDIHCGARELLYPHHEAHLAQMKALSRQQTPIRYWMHAGLLKIGSQKMSKSIGNVVSIRDAVRKYGSNVLHLYILSKHYRDDITFEEKELSEHKNVLANIVDAVHILNKTEDSEDGRTFVDRFYEAMDDDFDTPKALSVLSELCKSLSEKHTIPNRMLKAEMDKMLGILGLTMS